MGGKATKLWVYVTNQWRIQTFRGWVGGGGDVSKKFFFGALGLRAKGKEKIFSLPSACRLFSRGVIFTRARVSLALLSLRKNGGTNRSLLRASVWFKNKGGGAGPGPPGLSPRSATTNVLHTARSLFLKFGIWRAREKPRPVVRDK